MTTWYKVGGTDEVAASEEEAMGKIHIYYSEGKIPIKCIGSLTFEDYRTANFYFNKIVYQNPGSIFYVDSQNETNPLYFDVTTENIQTLAFNFNRFFFKELAPQNLSMIQQTFEAALYGKIIFETGSHRTNPSTFVNTNCFKKNKPENIREVKIRGEATFNDYAVAKENYTFLTLRLPNTIFYPPSEIFANIRLEGAKLLFDCHRFFEESLIEENRKALEKVFRLARSGWVTVEDKITENAICQYTMKCTAGGFEISEFETYRLG